MKKSSVRKQKVDQFQIFLLKHAACIQGRSFCRGKTVEEFWATCDRADWMRWLLARVAGKPGNLTYSQYQHHNSRMYDDVVRATPDQLRQCFVVKSIPANTIAS